MDNEIRKKYQRAYAKLTPAQQQEFTDKARAAADAAKAYADARDHLFGKATRDQDRAFAAYEKTAKRLGLPVVEEE